MSKTNKEALYVVLDVGLGMTVLHHDSKTSMFDCCKQIVDTMIQRKIFHEFSGALGLITVNALDSANYMFSKSRLERYSHIAVQRKLGAVNWEVLETIDKLTSTSVSSCDLISSLVVAAHHLRADTADLGSFPSRRLLILSCLDGITKVTDDETERIIESLRNENIMVDIICPHDIEQIVNDETVVVTDSSVLSPMVGTLSKIVSALDGSFYSFNEAASAMVSFETRQLKSAPINYMLTIGSTIQIPVSMFVKVKENKHDLLKFKRVYRLDNSAEVRVQSKKVIRKTLEEIDEDDIVTGYYYGDKFIAIDFEGVQQLFQTKSEKCLSIIGFTPWKNIKPYMYSGEGVYVLKANQKTSNESSKALVALLTSLFETDSVAIVRKVFNCRSNPELGCLLPDLETKSLFYLRLPFAEDLRLTSSSRLSAISKPSEKQLDAIDALIDDMMLVPMNGEESEEKLKPEETFNPVAQTLIKRISQKMLNHTMPIGCCDFPNFNTCELSDDMVQQIRKHFVMKDMSFTRAVKKRSKLPAEETAESRGKHEIASLLNDRTMETIDQDVIERGFEFCDKQELAQFLRRYRTWCVQNNKPENYNQFVFTTFRSEFHTLGNKEDMQDLRMISYEECPDSHVFSDEASSAYDSAWTDNSLPMTEEDEYKSEIDSGIDEISSLVDVV